MKPLFKKMISKFLQDHHVIEKILFLNIASWGTHIFAPDTPIITKVVSVISLLYITAQFYVLLRDKVFNRKEK